MNKKAKLEYFNNFDSSQGSKPFWVKCKPYFYFSKLYWVEGSYNVPPSYTSDDDIVNIVIKFVNHPSIKTVKQNFTVTSKFSFQPVSVNDMK